MRGVTIRDVAEAAGVSITTVHLALSGKNGVSAGTRERITRLAAEMGYQPNSIAAGLSRKTQRIAVALPSEKGGGRMYFAPIWQGIRDYLSQNSDMNIECIELPFRENASPDQADNLLELKSLIRENRLDGLLTSGHLDALTEKEWQKAEEEGMTTVQIICGSPACKPLCTVAPEYQIIGRTMAELILSHIPSFGSIVMCAGNPDWAPHADIVSGFMDYLKENGALNRVYTDYHWNTSEESYQSLLSLLSNPDVAACCSVLSKSGVLLARALRESGKAGHIFAVGSDLYEESIQALRDHVFQNVIQKNPYAQGYFGMKNLSEYLLLGTQPVSDKLYVGSEVVFRSTLAMYDHGHYRSLLL